MSRPWRPWAARKVEVPAPDDAGTLHGLAYALYRPEDAEPAGGVVILHGAGSSKESHLDFARACRAHGLAAVAFDQRGHGASAGPMDARAVDDVAAIASLLHPLPVGLRGSSMGGWLALVAAETVGARAAPGSRLVAVPGGHHRSVQHDPELQALTLRFLRKRLGGESGS
jgi:pimeloyl-ACP methyl ester carboxylesterase